MSDSFLNLRVKPPVQNSYLRSDWSLEEDRFEKNKVAFLNGISVANTISETPQFLFSAEVQSIEDVVSKDKKSQEKNAGTACVAVESNDVTKLKKNEVAVPISTKVTSATIATKELSVVPVSSDIDDIFGDSAAPKQSTFEDDFFSAPSSASTKPAVKAEDAEAFVTPIVKKAPVVDGDDDIFGPSKPVVAVATPVTTEAQIESYVATKATVEVAMPPATGSVECPPIDMSYGPEAMEGFNPVVFEKVNATAHEMLHWMPNDDIQHLANQIQEYAVEINTDYLRGHNPNYLSDKLVEIQSKRDGLYTLTIRWQPVFTAIRQAEKYVLSAGLVATEAKPVDKKTAQIKAAIPLFWKRHSDILALENLVQRTHENLCGWYECLSRLISSMQLNNKIGEIARGEVPFDGPYKKVPQIDIPDTPEANSEMSQPISVPKLSGCQSFANVGKPTSSKFKAGEIDW